MTGSFVEVCRKVSFGNVVIRYIPYEDRRGFWAIDGLRFRLRVQKIDELLQKSCFHLKRLEKSNKVP